MSEEVNNIVGTLIDQLKDNNHAMEKVRQERDPLKKEDLEKFVIETGGDLVRDALDMVATVKDYVISAPNSDDVEALAGLINATSAAIETLSKINIQDKKTEASVKLKTMDIQAKKELVQAEGETKLLATREEVMKLLLKNAKPIQAEIIENNQLID